MVDVLKIPNYESIDSIFESYYNSDKLAEEKIKNNLETLYAREDISKEERDKLATECGNGLEFGCYIELGYYYGTNEYYFDAESMGADFDEEEFHENIGDLVKVINKILSKRYNLQYGTRMKPLFYTVVDHESVNNETTGAMKAFKEFFGSLDSRGLTNEEIEKFQNLFKAAV